MIIRIMEDYGSTGFWNEQGACINAPEWLPYHLKILVKYWHYEWEHMMTRYEHPQMDGETLAEWEEKSYQQSMNRWRRDRSFIVEALNAVTRDGVTFV